MSEKNRKPIARLTLVTTAKDELDVKARGGDHGSIDCYSRAQLDDKIAGVVASFMDWKDPAQVLASPNSAKTKTRVQQTIQSTLRWTFLDGSDLPGSVTLETNHRHDRFATECLAVAAIAKAQGFKK